MKTEERMLLQFHYTEWHSHTTPFSNAILEFRRRVRSVVGNTLKSNRPMLVHCNDGGKCPKKSFSNEWRHGWKIVMRWLCFCSGHVIFQSFWWHLTGDWKTSLVDFGLLHRLWSNFSFFLPPFVNIKMPTSIKIKTFFILNVYYLGGRSGVYLAIDSNIEQAEEEDSFYVFGYLKKLRQSRKGLIENVEQYKFVYDTLEEYVVCGNSFFPVKELSQKLKQKSVKDPATKLNEYQKEYAQICKQTPRFSIGDCAGGHRWINLNLNIFFSLNSSLFLQRRQPGEKSRRPLCPT